MFLVEAKSSATAETEYCYYRLALEKTLAAFEAVRACSHREIAVGVELLGLTREFAAKLEAFLGELQATHDDWEKQTRERSSAP